jgi:hypothetical protein
MGRLDNYEEVKDRLPRFWDCVKQGRITTEILDHSENWDRVVMKASLFDGETLIATGTAMDWKDKDRNANKTNWVEVAETSAIGRAIANSRYQDPNANRPSREEMEVAKERQVSSSALANSRVSSGVSKEIVADVQNAEPTKAEAILTEGNEEARQLGNLLLKTGLTNVVVSNFFEARGWIKKGQMWTEASPEKLVQIYERAKSNPEGFVKALA